MSMNMAEVHNMKHTITLVTLLVMTLVIGCRKEDTSPPIPEETKLQATQFEVLLDHGPWQLKGYYTLEPVDYDLKDSVPAKTNHWEYVSGWLKDDQNFFYPDGTISISQMEIWMPGTTMEIISGVNWKVTPTHQGVEWEFLNFTYEPLMYKLISMGENQFKVSAVLDGHEVISEFKALR